MSSQPPDFVLESLRGGLNNQDPASALQPDQCTIANNVEFFFSTLGERRRGTEAIDLTGSGLETEALIVFLTRHFPDANEKDTELWAIGATEGASIKAAYRDGSLVWHTVSLPNTPNVSSPYIYQFAAQSLNGKLFLAYKSAVDRLHVWDGTSVRVTGLAEPGVPSVANEGSGTYAGTRYFRVRYVSVVAGKVERRSEPSDSVTFVPSGTGAGAEVTKPAAINEGETDWEVEASEDNANFYRIARVAVATTTYDDTTPFATGYAASGVLSENIGTYTLIPSVRYLGADDDRLLVAADFENATLDSYVAWTPVANDPGVGNDERLPADVNFYYNLNSYEGGGVTGISQAVSGSWYAFKWGHIYKLVRTGSRQTAYSVIALSKARGALPSSIVSGMDEYGRPTIYHLDPRIGPSRIGPQGIQHIRGLLATWRTVNTAATKVLARGVYYSDKYQVHWWVPTGASNTPTLRLVLQVTEVREQADGVWRGWSTADGLSATALAATIMPEVVTDPSGAVDLVFRPYIGLPTPYFIHRCDVGRTDGGAEYTAQIRSRPFFQVGLLNRWGAMTAALLATANPYARLIVRFIRDFGLDEHHVLTSFEPVGTEEYVIRDFDNLTQSEARGIQIEFIDPPIEDRR